jgi:hypothetical protein
MNAKSEIQRSVDQPPFFISAHTPLNGWNPQQKSNIKSRNDLEALAATPQFCTHLGGCRKNAVRRASPPAAPASRSWSPVLGQRVLTTRYSNDGATTVAASSYTDDSMGRLATLGHTPTGGTAVQVCIARNRPYGDASWQESEARRLDLTHTLRSEGRPKVLRNAQKANN